MPCSEQTQKGIDLMVNFFKQRPNLKVLDVGVGMGKWSKLVRETVNTIHGVEAFEPYVERFKLESLYDKIYIQDIREFEYEEKYDVAILGDVLEHLEYEDAIKLILKLKAKIPVIFLTIPISDCPQDGALYGNDYETHRYQWNDTQIQTELSFKLLSAGRDPGCFAVVGTYMWPSAEWNE